MKLWEKILIVASLLCFGFACVFYLSGMGLSETEANVGVESLVVFHQLRSFDFDLSVFPVMENYYVGALLRYICVPFFFVCFDPVFALRISTVFYAFAFLFFVFKVLDRWFGRATALSVLVLLCFNSTLIRGVRTGTEREEVLQLFFAWGFLYCCTKISDGKRWFLFVCAFITGLALWAKLMFVGYMVGWTAAVLACGSSLIEKTVKKFPRTKNEWFGTIGLCLLGMAPFIGYNISSGFETVRLAFASISKPTQLGWDNSAFFHNIRERVHDFYQMLTGRFDYIENIVNPCPIDYWSWLFLAALPVVLLYLVFSRRPVFSKQKTVFIVVFNAVVFVLLTYVPYGHSAEHVMVLMPIAEIVIVLALCIIGRKLRIAAQAGTVLMCLILLPQIANETSIVVRVLNRSRSGEVRTTNSYALKRAADFLVGQGGVPLVSPDIVSYRLGFYSDLKLEPITYLNYWHPQDVDVRPAGEFYESALTGLDSFWLVGLTWGQEKEYLSDLKKVLAAAGREVELREQFFGGTDTQERVELYFVSGASK